MENQFCIVHYIDGRSMKFQFPPDPKKRETVARYIEDGLTRPTLAVELEGKLVVIPMNQVRYLEFSPAPDNLPKAVIRGAVLVE